MTAEPQPVGGAAPRVVSLVPAATEIVARLDALEVLVGVSHLCDFPPEVRALPHLTSFGPPFVIDAAMLRALAPTVIITQSLCDVCAPSDADVRAAVAGMHPPPAIVTMTGNTLDGVWADFRRIGAAIGREPDALELLESIAHRLRAVHETLKAAKAPRPRVAVIEWLDPLFVAGHWSPELVRRAGGVDVLAEAGMHSVTTNMERIQAAKPELLLFAPCGFDVERAARDSVALLARDEWRWAHDLEAWALDGNALTSRPGPRLADAVEVMAAIFAPTLFDAPRTEYAELIREKGC